MVCGIGYSKGEGHKDAASAKLPTAGHCWLQAWVGRCHGNARRAERGGAGLPHQGQQRGESSQLGQVARRAGMASSTALEGGQPATGHWEWDDSERGILFVRWRPAAHIVTPTTRARVRVPAPADRFLVPY